MSSFRKSLANKLKKTYKPTLLDLVLFGTPKFELLETGTTSISNITNKIRNDIESLKLSASDYGLCSASAPQFGIQSSIFIIAKNLSKGIWFDSNLRYEQDYNVFINPKIIGVSSVKEPNWEYCGSFPNLKSYIKRYSRIKVNYLDEDFEEIEKTLEDFHARVFQHELDHLYGDHMLQMSISEGNVEYKDTTGLELENFKNELDNYKDKVANLKKQYPEAFENKTTSESNEIKDFDYFKQSNSNMEFSIEGQLFDNLFRALEKDWDIRLKSQLNESQKGQKHMK